MPKAEKAQLVERLREDIHASNGMYLTDYRGLTVGEMAELRGSLRESGAQYKVVKNSLFKLASEGIGDSRIAEMLEGPTAVAFVHNDPVLPAKTIVDFMEHHKTLSVKGAYLDGQLYDVNQVVALSKVPPREVLFAQLVGSIQGPISSLVGTLQGIVRNLVYTLRAVADKKVP